MKLHRKGYVRAAVATVVILFSPFTSQTAAEVPDWIAGSDTEQTGRPLWVSIDEAAPNGYLRWDLFEPSIQDSLRQSLEEQAPMPSGSVNGTEQKGCTTWLVPSGTTGDAWSAEELFERAGALYTARIEDASQGFLNGALGTLIEVSLREIIKNPVSGALPQRFFVFYRYAEVRLEEGLLCVRDVRDPAKPRIGGALILAPTDPDPAWPEPPIFWAEDTELFFDSDSGKMSAPYAYGNPAAPLTMLEDELRAEGQKEIEP